MTYRSSALSRTVQRQQQQKQTRSKWQERLSSCEVVVVVVAKGTPCQHFTKCVYALIKVWHADCFLCLSSSIKPNPRPKTRSKKCFQLTEIQSQKTLGLPWTWTQTLKLNRLETAQKKGFNHQGSSPRGAKGLSLLQINSISERAFWTENKDWGRRDWMGGRA